MKSIAQYPIVLYIGVALLSVGSFSCNSKSDSNLGAFQIINTTNDHVNHQGKLKEGQYLEEIYTKVELDPYLIPDFDDNAAKALDLQLDLLKKREQDFDGLLSNVPMNKSTLEHTIRKLQFAMHSPFFLAAHFDLYKLQGNDHYGNVYFTGYFTPILEVRQEANAEFKYPLYACPENITGMFPTREQIEAGALNGFNLELAYAKDKLDIYFMQVQGSGIVEFENGDRSYLAFTASNRHPYRSIGRYMVEHNYTTSDRVSMKSLKSYFAKNPHQLDSILNINPSFVFFKPSKSVPGGSGHVPLTANASIAVDDKHIPLGACLLAEQPMIDSLNELSHYEYKFLFAQDTGGAIRGPGHIDVYSGVGPIGRQRASSLHHYGRLYLLLDQEAVLQFSSDTVIK